MHWSSGWCDLPIDLTHEPRPEKQPVCSIALCGFLEGVWYDGSLDTWCQTAKFWCKSNLTAFNTKLPIREVCLCYTQIHWSKIQILHHQGGGGVPQGTLLGAVVWTIFINDLPEQVNHADSKRKSTIYADDVTTSLPIHKGDTTLTNVDHKERLMNTTELQSARHY